MNGGGEEVRAGHGKHRDVPASPVSLPHPLSSLPHSPIPLRHSAINKESAAFRWRAMRPSVKPRPLSPGPHFFSRSISHSLGCLPPPESPHHLLPNHPPPPPWPALSRRRIRAARLIPAFRSGSVGSQGPARDERENSFIFPFLGKQRKAITASSRLFVPLCFFPDGEPLSRPS